MIDQLSGVALAALDRAAIDDDAREVLRGLATAVTHAGRSDAGVEVPGQPGTLALVGGCFGPEAQKSPVNR